jgi:hypothetical protein
MKGVIQKLLAMGINMIKNIEETKNILFGSLVGSRIKKWGSGACFSNKFKKRGKKEKAVSISIQAQPELCHTSSFFIWGISTNSNRFLNRFLDLEKHFYDGKEERV